MSEEDLNLADHDQPLQYQFNSISYCNFKINKLIVIKQPKESDSRLLQKLVEKKNQMTSDLKDGTLTPSVYT